MTRRPLGRSGLQVSPLAFGGNVFGWTVDGQRTFELLDAWVEAGGNFIDTADVYSVWVPGHAGGESETLIGRWLRARRARDRIVLASKVGKRMPDGGRGLHPDHIRKSIDASLARLQTDYLDLYQVHDDDPDVPLAETLGALGDLIRAGKVRAIGASNHVGARLAEALRVSESFDLPRYESLQPLYNLMARSPHEDDTAPVCAHSGIGVIGYYALAEGFLTGKYRKPEDARLSPRGAKVVGRYLNPRGLRVLAALDDVADRRRASVAQVALAWQLARPGITAAIVSATTLDQLADIVGATRLALDAEDMARLDAASDSLSGELR